MRGHYAERIIVTDAPKIPLTRVPLSDFHFSRTFEVIIFEGFACSQNAIDLEFFGDSDSQGAGEGKIKESNLIGFIKLFKTLLKDKMIELFMHRQ